MSLCGICSEGSGIAQCPTRIKMHNCWLFKGYLCQRIARDIVSTTDNGVNATADRVACLRTLVVSQSVTKVLFHSCSNGVDERLGAQLQPIVNGADIIVNNVVMRGNGGRSNVGCSNITFVGRA